jgi:hypothetical protein
MLRRRTRVRFVPQVREREVAELMAVEQRTGEASARLLCEKERWDVDLRLDDLAEGAQGR